MKNFSICVLLFIVSVNCAMAQYKNAGKLNVWAKNEIRRSYDEDSANNLCTIRTARNDGFDRVVFEFREGKPNYIIRYLESNFYSSDEGDERNKNGGRVFMQISLYGVSYESDESLCKFAGVPKGKLNFPVVLQFADKGYFEGIRDFLIGVKAKKPFRVQELFNPSRLVIDFKH